MESKHFSASNVEINKGLFCVYNNIPHHLEDYMQTMYLYPLGIQIGYYICQCSE